MILHIKPYMLIFLGKNGGDNLVFLSKINLFQPWVKRNQSPNLMNLSRVSNQPKTGFN